MSEEVVIISEMIKEEVKPVEESEKTVKQEEIKQEEEVKPVEEEQSQVSFSPGHHSVPPSKFWS
jgi:hypothetical protein